jgi:hypothetical protein
MGGSDPAEVRAGLALIEQACQRIDRDPAGIGVRVSLFPPRDAVPGERIAGMLAPLTELVDAGVTLVQVPLPQLVDRVEDTHEVLAAVVAAAADLVGATTV